MSRRTYNGYTEKSYYENKRFTSMITTGDVLNEGYFYTLYNTIISDTGLSVKPRKGFLTTTIKDDNQTYTLSANTIYYKDPESDSVVFIDLDSIYYEQPTDSSGELEPFYNINSYICHLSEYSVTNKYFSLDDTENNRVIHYQYLVNEYNEIEDNLFNWLSNYYIHDTPFKNKNCKLRALDRKGISVFDSYGIQRFLFRCELQYDYNTTNKSYNKFINIYLLVNYNKTDNKILLRVLDTKQQYSIDPNSRNLASDQSIIPDPMQVVYTDFNSTPDSAYNYFNFIYNVLNYNTSFTKYSLNINNYYDIRLLPNFMLMPLNAGRSWAYAYDIYSSATNPSENKHAVYHSPVFYLDNSKDTQYAVSDTLMQTKSDTIYNYLCNPDNDPDNDTLLNYIEKNICYITIVPKNSYTINITIDPSSFTDEDYDTILSSTSNDEQKLAYLLYSKSLPSIRNAINNNVDKAQLNTLYDLYKQMNSCTTIQELYSLIKTNKEFLNDYNFLVSLEHINSKSTRKKFLIHPERIGSLYSSDTIADPSNASLLYSTVDNVLSTLNNTTCVNAIVNILPVYCLINTLNLSISAQGYANVLNMFTKCFGTQSAYTAFSTLIANKFTNIFSLSSNTAKIKSSGGVETDYTIQNSDQFMTYTNTVDIKLATTSAVYNLTSLAFTFNATVPNSFMNIEYIYKLLNNIDMSNCLDSYMSYKNNVYKYDQYPFNAAYIGNKTTNADYIYDTVDSSKDLLFNYSTINDNRVLISKLYSALLPELNKLNFFENNVFNITMYISSIPTPIDTSISTYYPHTLYYSNVDRDTFTATAALRQSLVLNYKLNNDWSYITETITEEPQMVASADGTTVFDSEEGDRVVIWKNNRVFISDISIGSDINNFTQAYTWKFEEPVIKCVPYKHILLVFTTQNLYAIYPYTTTTPVATETTDNNTGTKTTTTKNIETIIYKRACVLYNIMPDKRYKDCICVFNQMVFFYGNGGQLYLIKPVTTIDDDTRFSLQQMNKSINDIFLNYVDYINLRLKQYGNDYNCTEDDVTIKAFATIDKIKIIYSVPNIYTMFIIYDNLLNSFSIEDTTSTTNIIDTLVCDSGTIYTTLCKNNLRITLPYREPNTYDNNVDMSIDDNFQKRDILMSLDTGDINLNNHMLKRFKTLKVYYKNIDTDSVMFNVATFVDGAVAYSTTSNAIEIRDMNGSTTIMFTDPTENFKEINGTTKLTFVDDEHYKEITEDRFTFFDFSNVISSKTITNETSIISTGKDIRFRFNFKSKGVYKFLGYSIIFKEHHV